jgi:hypothetical protein
LANLERAIPTSGVWENHFAAWAEPVVSQAADIVLKGFSPMVEQFVRSRRANLEEERKGINDWFQQRTQEIIGNGSGPNIQIGLFEGDTRLGPTISPTERLASFAADIAQSVAKRHGADGVLRI